MMTIPRHIRDGHQLEITSKQLTTATCARSVLISLFLFHLEIEFQCTVLSKFIIILFFQMNILLLLVFILAHS